MCAQIASGIFVKKHCLFDILFLRRASSDSDPQYDYMVAILIGIGTAMFMTSTDGLTFDFDVYGEQTSAKWTGVMLMVFFLFFDSFTSQVCRPCNEWNT